jgi:hypothetical protein
MARGRGIFNNGRSKPKKPQFIGLPHGVFDAAIEKQIGAAAMVVLIAVIRRHNGHNNGEIAFPSRDGKKLGFSKTTTAQALKTLCDRGFLTREREAAFTTKTRLAAEYALSWLPVGTRQPAHEWKISLPEIKHGPATGTDSPATGTDSPATGTDSPATGTVSTENGRRSAA